MNIWMLGKNLMKHNYLKKEDFYSHLNMEDIIDADCTYIKIVYKHFEINNLGEYHDFYVQSNTLLLADVFENFRNMCLKICEFILQNFFQRLD